MTEASAPLAPLEPLGDAGRWTGALEALRPVCALLGSLAPAELRVLTRYLDVYRGAAGSEIAREGEPGEFMALVVEGRVASHAARGERAVHAPAELGPGGTFGELALIDDMPHEATWVVREPAIVAVLRRESLARVVIEHPGLGAKILMALVSALSAELRATRAGLAALRDRAEH